MGKVMQLPIFMSMILGILYTGRILGILHMVTLMMIQEIFPMIKRNTLLYTWMIRICVYVSLFLSIIFISPTILGISNVDISTTNSPYAISTLIQAEASIFALVITLTIIAVQQASSYSPRIINIFKYRNPDLWIVLVSYILIMVYGLRVLLQESDKYVPLFSSSILPITLDPSLLTFSYGVFAFVALLFYTWYTIDLLRPTKIIEILAEKITINKISTENNPIQPIIDIISYFMIDKHENEIPINGLKKIEDKIILFFKSGKFTSIKNETREFQNIKTLIEQSDVDESVTIKNIKAEYNLLLFIHEKHQNEKDKLFDKYYRKWKIILDDETTNYDYLSLFLKGESEKHNNLKKFIFLRVDEYEVLDQIYSQLEHFGLLATKETNYEIVNEVTSTIKKIGVTAAKNDLKYPLRRTTILLEKIATSAVNQKMNSSVEYIIELLSEMEVELDRTMYNYSYPLISESTENIYSKLEAESDESGKFAKDLKKRQSDKLMLKFIKYLKDKQDSAEHHND